jgi:hypothetical protein
LDVTHLVAALHHAVANPKGTTLDWRLIVAMPGAAGAALGLLAYSIGLFRPLKIVDATYWEQPSPPTAGFECVIKNRSLLWDRTLSALLFVEVTGQGHRPRLSRRAIHAKRVQASGEIIDAIAKSAVKISKRDEHRIVGELAWASVGRSVDQCQLRVEAHAGRRRSRWCTLRALGGREEIDSGGKLLFLVDEIPDLVEYLKEMALSEGSGRRHELRLLLQQKILIRASERGRRVTLSYLVVNELDEHGALHPEWKCPGWGSQTPPIVDSSTEHGRHLLMLLHAGMMRICASKSELNARPDYLQTARDPLQFPAYAVIPMLAGGNGRLPVGILEVESRDVLLPVDTAELIALASVLACARLLDRPTASIENDADD